MADQDARAAQDDRGQDDLGVQEQAVRNGNAGDIGNNNINLQPVSGIRPPQPLVLDANLSDNWKLFLQKWNNFCIISCVNTKSAQYQCALLGMFSGWPGAGGEREGTR